MSSYQCDFTEQIEKRYAYLVLIGTSHSSHIYTHMGLEESPYAQLYNFVL